MYSLFKYTLGLFLVTVLCSTCKKDDPEPPFLKIQETDLIQDFGAGEGSKNVAVKTNREYVATSSQSWCAVTTSKDYLTISVSKNEDIKERVATIRVSSEGLPYISLVVTQDGAAPFLEIPQAQLSQTFGMEGGSKKVTVNTNQKYQLKSSQSWCTPVVFEDYFTIAVPEYEGFEQRTATITVSSEGLPDIMVTVTQAGFSPFLEIPEDQLNQQFGTEGGNKTITVTTNQKYTVTSSQSWCYVAVTGEGIKISVARNETIEQQKAFITVASKDLPDVTITVTQAGITPVISVQESNVWVQCGTREFTLMVTSNVPVAFELPSWIQEKAGNPSGSGTQKFTFVASSSTTVQGNLVVKSTNGAVKVTVPVVQQETLEVKAMTYNVRVYSLSDGDNNWPNRKDAAAQIIRNEAADVVGTQEMSKNILADQFNDLKTLLSADYDSYGYGREENSLSDEYNAIFYKKSRFNLISSGHFWLSSTPDVKSKGWDAGYNRIAVWTILEDKASRQRFFVINTHLDNTGTTARTESVKLILSKINTLSGGLPVILTGDFNAVPTSVPIQYLTGSATPNHLVHAKDVAGTKNGPNWTIHDYDATPENQRIFIDYVFTNQPSKVSNHSVLPEKLNGVFLSDHCPVTARILLIKKL